MYTFKQYARQSMLLAASLFAGIVAPVQAVTLTLKTNQ